MPVDTAAQAATLGRYENRHAVYVPDCVTHASLKRISGSQSGKMPTKCNAASALYFMACIVPSVQLVSSNSSRVATTNKNQDCTDVGASVMPGAICRVGTCQPRLMPVPLTTIDIHAPAALLAHADQQLPVAAQTIGWGLPLAAASPPQTSSASWDAEHQMFTLENEADKGAILKLLKDLLLESGEINQVHADHLEFVWRYEAAGTALCVAPATSQLLFARSKRISRADWEKSVIQHIKQNCAIETEIINSEGLSEGKLLILKAQRSENPFRILYETTSKDGHSEVLRHTSIGLNLFSDIVSMGIKPVIGGILAALYRKSYFEKNGDQVCAARQRHLSFTLLATGLEVDGLRQPWTRRKIAKIPVELENVIRYDSHAAYFARNKETAVQRELLLTASSAEKAREKVFLKPTSEGDFLAHPMPETSSAQQVPKRVVFDEQGKVWHYADDPDSPPLNIEMHEGEAFIVLHDGKYPIRINENRQANIVVTRAGGKQEQIPVFQDPFSKNWHLRTQNFHPIFTPTQIELIKRLRIVPDKQHRYTVMTNRYADADNAGRIFEVRNVQDDVETTAPLYLTAEINGELVPIRMGITEKRGPHYMAYDIRHPMRQGHPIKWDGARWQFESWTSPHVSRELNRRIKSDMFADKIDESLLALGDRQGIRWAADGRGYIKVRRKLVEIEKGRITYLRGPDGGRIAVQYKNHQFHPMPPATLSKMEKSIDADMRLAQLIGMLNTLSKTTLMSGVKMVDMEKKAALAFSPEKTRIESVPSEAIEKKRFVLFVADAEHVLETTIDGQDVRILEGEAAQLAVEKYSNSLTGGSVQQVFSVCRERPENLAQAGTRKEIDDIATQRIEAGAQLLKDVIEKEKNDDNSGKMLILGHADFLGTSAFENNVFASPDAIYQALIDYFIPLSKSHPRVIIAPGSIYLSKDIPESLRGSGLVYQQGGNKRKLENAINFATILAPVFYNGKLVTLARKGEYLRYRQGNDGAGGKLLTLSDLSQTIRAGTTLIAPHGREDDIATISELGEMEDIHSGAIFVGKTYLPEEKERASWYFCPCEGDSDNAILDNLFNSEFMIDNEKFLIVIEDEFEKKHGYTPSVRRKALSTNGSADDGNRYDWILHPAAGKSLDTALRRVGDNYLYADINTQSECISAAIRRLHINTYWKEKHVTIFNCAGDL